ncbi:SCO family protein (plasmid) [Skermanella sp. TT6]|uniref:SCO family protein n=1 Tax=Skermanella cutis TaxID=2775420 RepID=A0ABX7BJH9_9PROT|nr:SCO family protein [Skermanella sp. TT6]QQP93409.1 SCO family protein [Skermanella sp. TT6]
MRALAPGFALFLFLFLFAAPAAVAGPGHHPGGFDYDPPEPGTYRLPPLAPAADGTALDETGEVRGLHDLMAGRITVLGFIYTRCGDVCPLGTQMMSGLHEATAGDPALAAGVRLVTMSFDPGHDTPEVMAEQARALRGNGGADWQFLTSRGGPELETVLAAYDQRVLRKPDPDDPAGPLAHQLRVYLIDGERRIRNIYSLDFLDPRLVLADIRTLMLEHAARH